MRCICHVQCIMISSTCRSVGLRKCSDMVVLEVGCFVLDREVEWCGVVGDIWWWLELWRGNTESGNMSGFIPTGILPGHSKLYMTGHVVGFKGRLGQRGFLVGGERKVCLRQLGMVGGVEKWMAVWNICGDHSRNVFSLRVGKYCTLSCSIENLNFKNLKFESIHNVLHTLRIFKILPSPRTAYINYSGSPFWRAPHEKWPGSD